MGEYEAKRRFLAHIWLGLYHRAKITSVKLVVATDYRLYFVVLKKCTVLINLVSNFLETLLHRKMERLLFLI